MKTPGYGHSDAGGLALAGFMHLFGLASASAPGYQISSGAFHKATVALAPISRLSIPPQESLGSFHRATIARAPVSRLQVPSQGNAEAVPAALSLVAQGAVKLEVPAKRAYAPMRSAQVSVASADEAGAGGIRLMPTASRGAGLERLKDARVAAADGGAAAAGGDTDGGEHRELQGTTCASGSGVFVTSSEYPLLEGCLSEVELLDSTINDEIEYQTEAGQGFIYASTFVGETEVYWFAAYLPTTTSEEVESVCVSEELASTVHPSEATWICLLSDGSTDYATDTQFGVDCGCDGGGDDDSPVPAPTPAAAPTASGSCAAGSGVAVTSSEFPLLEGCLAEIDLFEGGEVEFLSDTGIIIALPLEDDPDTEKWFSLYGSDALDPDTMTQACNSEEPASLVHPSEATWICLFPDGSVDYATSTTFGVDCGCDGPTPTPPTPEPTPEPTPTPVTATPEPTPEPETMAPTAGSRDLPTSTPGPVAAPTPAAAPTASGSCAAGSGVFVTSSEFPEMEGCMVEIELLEENGEIEYINESGLAFIFASLPTGETEELWFAQYRESTTSDAEQLPACNSEEPASLVHPSEATWVCLFPDGSVDYGTSTTFGVDCGCDEDATTEPPAPSTDLTPSPASTPAGGTCAAGSGVFVTSSEFPEMEGCMAEMEVLDENDEIEYINETGTAFILAGLPTGETEEIWFAQYRESTTSDAEQLPACNSEEPASLVHPSEATWVCGFPDGSVDYGTSTTFGVDCGCDEDATTEPPAPSTDLTPSPASTPAGGACAAGSGVFVTSSEFPEMEGCMVEIEILEENDEIEYITETGLAFIYATVPTDMTEEFWFAQYRESTTSDAEQLPACNSEEPASLVHPSEATWVCAFPDGSIDYGTSTTFGVACGCDGSSPPSPSATPEPTPAVPVVNPSAPSPGKTPSPDAGDSSPTPPPIPTIGADDDSNDQELTVEDNETGAAAVNRPIYTWSVAAAAAGAAVMAAAMTGGAW